MGFFKDLKFGGGDIGTFDNSKFSPGKLLDLAKNGMFRTEGIFAPGYSNKFLQNPVNFVTGLVIPEDGAPNSNKDPEWQPTLSIPPITLKTKGTDDLTSSEKRFAPGFLPPGALAQQIVDKDRGKGKGFGSGNVGTGAEYVWSEGNEWIGQLLNSHLESPYYTKFIKNFKSIEIDSNIEEEKAERTEDEKFSARDYYTRFNDTNTDYFRHGLHIEGLTKTKSGKNTREAWDGGGEPFRLENFTTTSHEQNDPVVYGFEIIFDTINSPLLNGAVEDFIAEFSYISEIASKAIVMDDFKRQFMKIFKTRASLDARFASEYDSDNVLINKQRQGQTLMSNTDSKISAYSSGQSQTELYRTGKKAYMGYYLQKVDGLANLSESNTGDKKKYLVDYRKDVIKLTFLEDLSLTMGTLAHLYKLLYWSKPNGKNLIPENLLRFNCDIIISECRNFSRVRKATNKNSQTERERWGQLDIIKDNVSKYVYNLRECQFWFDKMSHEDSIDMGNIKVYGDGASAYEVSFDYKYSSMKLEKWVPDPEKFGRYVGYHNGAIWKRGNKKWSAEVDGSFLTKDTSVPKFYTVNTNSQRQNGVTQEIIMDSYRVINAEVDEVGTLPPRTAMQASNGATLTDPAAPKSLGDSIGDDEEDKSSKKTARKKKRKESLEQFKENSKAIGVKMAKSVAGFAFGEINNQISTRADMLENTINKARNLLGMGGLDREPKNVYPKPYTPHSFGLFFDVRNELFNFIGNEVAGIISGAMNTILPGTQLNFPFKMPNLGATIHQLTSKFSLYDLEARLLGEQRSKDAKKPFFDSSHHSTKFAGQSVNKLFNTNTKFTFPKLPDDLNFQGMALVKFGGGKGDKPGSVLPKPDFLKPKGNLFSDGNTKPSVMLDKFSLPGISSGKGAQRTYIPIGTKNFNHIGFGVTKGDVQKYPAPVTPGPQGKLFSDSNTGSNLLSKYSSPKDFSGRGADRIGKTIIGSTNYLYIGFPKSAQKYPDPIMGMNDFIQGTKGNLYSPNNNLIFRYSNPSEKTGRGESQIYKPIGTKDYSQIVLGNSISDPQKYPAPLTQGTKGNLYSPQDNLVFKYSNPSEKTGRGASQISKPIGTKDYSQIVLGNSISDPQKYPAPLSQGTKGNLFSPWRNLLFRYSNPSEKTGRGESQISKPIGTKDYSQIGLGNSISDPQKYPGPLTQKIESLESIVKNGTIWAYPVNNKKFGK